MEKNVDWKKSVPMRVYDTCEIQLPGYGGFRQKLFADHQYDKPPHLTSINNGPLCRLPHGTRMQVNRVQLEVDHWSGDNLVEYFRKSASFWLRINLDTKLDCSVAELGYSDANVDFVLDGTDSIDASIRIEANPFSEIKQVRFEEKLSIEYRTMKLPRWMQRGADRLGIELPSFERRVPHLMRAERPLEGSALVKVSLIGVGTTSLAR